MNVRKWVMTAPLLGVLLGGQGASAGTLLLSSDFESALPAEFSGSGVRESSQGYSVGAPTFGNWFLRNASANPAVATTLTLNSLPTHTTLDLYFLLAVIDSWDGPANDTFNVAVDGVPVFTSGYSAFDANLPYGGTRLFFGGDGGFNTNWSDSGYSIALPNIPHTASTATIEFFAGGPGWAGGDDESWAIDNVQVYGSAPEPGSVALLLSGLAAVVAIRRRK